MDWRDTDENNRSELYDINKLGSSVQNLKTQNRGLHLHRMELTDSATCKYLAPKQTSRHSLEDCSDLALGSDSSKETMGNG